ncbi:DNA helicase, partial [Tanacetum coccineum]
MATTSNPDKVAANKGKMIGVEPEVSNIADLRPTDCNKIIEAIVYRKWVSKHVQTGNKILFYINGQTIINYVLPAFFFYSTAIGNHNKCYPCLTPTSMTVYTLHVRKDLTKEFLIRQDDYELIYLNLGKTVLHFLCGLYPDALGIHSVSLGHKFNTSGLLEAASKITGWPEIKATRIRILGSLRGDINILLVGDPGTSKSQLLSHN